LGGDYDRFVVIPLPRLPAERNGQDPSQELELIRTRIVGKGNAEIIRDADAMKLLSEVGPDQNILAYAFNFKMPDGTVNASLAAANRLNKEIYDRLSINPGEEIYGYDLIVSTTDLDAATMETTTSRDSRRAWVSTDRTGRRSPCFVLSSWIPG
jgi:hypothetical protein